MRARIALTTLILTVPMWLPAIADASPLRSSWG